MKGILFKPEMIQAIVEGKKTQTRRVGKSRYRIGEIIYIKEAIHRFNFEYASYDLDFTPVMFLRTANRFHWRWTKDKLPAMFQPYEAARYFIKITDVRAERLQEITEQDAEEEGVTRPPNYSLVPHYREWFKYLWNKINKPPYDWQSNPWIWRYVLALEP